MTLDEAAYYAALRRNPDPTAGLITSRKTHIILAAMRGKVEVRRDNGGIISYVSKVSLDRWIASLPATKRYISFEPDVSDELDKRYKGQWAKMSDFVNGAVREKLGS